MRARELRIGNLILVNGMVAHLLNVDDFECDIQYEDKINEVSFMNNELRWFKDFAPIPLTEEWLVRFGFEYPTGGGRRDYGYLNKFYLGFYNNTWEIEIGGSSDGDRNHWVKIQYVHQLQNLYFALTGEELKHSY